MILPRPTYRFRLSWANKLAFNFFSQTKYILTTKKKTSPLRRGNVFFRIYIFCMLTSLPDLFKLLPLVIRALVGLDSGSHLHIAAALPAHGRKKHLTFLADVQTSVVLFIRRLYVLREVFYIFSHIIKLISLLRQFPDQAFLTDSLRVHL